MKYRTKPVLVEAWRWDSTVPSWERPDWLRRRFFTKVDIGTKTLFLLVNKDEVTINEGHWIVYYASGLIEFYMNEDFLRHFEHAEEPE